MIKYLLKPKFVSAPNEESYIEYEKLIAGQDVRIKIDSRTAQILDQTFDENGDLIDSPIILYFEPKPLVLF